jgi:outer membrane protein TolC
MEALGLDMLSGSMWNAFVIAVTLFSLAVPRSSRADELTLAQVVRLALERNERARIADLSLTIADASVRRARAGFLPTLTLGGSETLRPYTVEQNGRTVVRNNAASGALTLSQPLLSVTTFPLYASAKHNAEATRYDWQNQRRQLGFDAARAFFGVVAQQRVLSAAKRRLEKADASANDTRARAGAQLVSTNDVTRALVERAAAMQSVANAESALEQSRVALGYVVDGPVESDLRAPDDSLVPPDIDIGRLTDRAVAQRPDVASAIAAAAGASALADEPGLRFVPTLNAQAQARLADQPTAGDRYLDTLLTLNLNWNIWDAGVRGADGDSRKAAADTADLQVRALKRRVVADVKIALAALLAARSSLAAAREGVDAASRSADETAVLYKQGLAKAIELFNANQSRFDAEISLAAAQLALRQGELDLRAALGLYPVEGVQ